MNKMPQYAFLTGFVVGKQQIQERDTYIPEFVTVSISNCEAPRDN